MSTYFLLLGSTSDGSGGSDIVLPPNLWEPYRKMLEAQAAAYQQGERKTPPRTVEKEAETVEEAARETVREVIKEVQVPLMPDLTAIHRAIAELNDYNRQLEQQIGDIQAVGREKEKKMRLAAIADAQRQIVEQELAEMKRKQEELEDEYLLCLVADI